MFDNIFIMFILALLPIIWLIFSLCFLKWQAHYASFGAFIFAITEALFIWKLPFLWTLSAALEGFAMAIWPIVIVIIAAVFTYNLTIHTKAMEIIKRMITSVTNDKRILVLLIGWCFGGFLEGMAGFGVAIAIPASMLYAFGFDPVLSILVCLLANGCPTMFGSIGIPTATLASVTGLESGVLAFVQTIMTSPLLFITPFLMVIMVSGGLKGLKGIIPLITVSSVSFVIPEILAARFVGVELPVVIASVCSLFFTFIYAYFYNKKHETPNEYKMVVPVDKNAPKITVKSALVAWSPFILIFVFLLLTSKLVPFINEPLSAIKSSVLIYQGTDATPYTFTWVNTPGVLILFAGILGSIIQKCTVKETLMVFINTIKQMSKTIITMLCVLACAKIMGYAGMISCISAFFVTVLGNLYPLAAPIIGALGTFVTGSGTSSEVLFGNVQLEAARAIGANEYWLVAANSLGTSAGKMLAPQSIAIGCAACALSGKDGEILGKIAKYAFFYLIVMSLIVYFGLQLFF
ncbi:MAG: lactate permease LctP family transporter [Erysipelotrichaceae bacterium]|nr:lactate permease LctP family transporter [Erysipelotrichaceae bacterium]